MHRQTINAARDRLLALRHASDGARLAADSMAEGCVIDARHADTLGAELVRTAHEAAQALKDAARMSRQNAGASVGRTA